MIQCKHPEKVISGYKWDLGALKEISTEKLWTWTIKYGIGYDRDAYMGPEKCFEFEKELWFNMGK